MPPIHSINCDNGIQITDISGSYKFSATDVPPNAVTAQQVEDHINTNFLTLPSSVAGYQLQAHVFSASPLHVTVITANADAQIPVNWWQDPKVITNSI